MQNTQSCVLCHYILRSVLLICFMFLHALCCFVGCAVVENMLNENKLNVDAKKFELKNYANAIKATETAKDGVVVLTM